ncbi:ATP-binding protein [Leptolyngbya sp. FACHB-261]|uniref:ATP-binding protein n=1 Tax=Leptolyngbya sp. FACHB-261 TaxID=2692806 RepID=UPI0016845922|nr:ATP-binding protein [Leptolyngbya sp. FACHB-261]MBD2104196.1 AAA family ATPase [Leptolyngbya sp. FACHB-261]
MFQPVPTSAQEVAASSVLKRFVVSPNRSAPLTWVVSGLAGSGKSSLLLSFPRPLVIDVEGSTHHKQIPPGATVAEVRNWADFCALVEALKQDCPFETVALDTLDALWVLLAGHDPQWQEHGRLYTSFKGTLETLRGLGVHLALSAHVQRVVVPGRSGSREPLRQYRVDLREKLRLWLEGWADVVLYLSESSGRYSLISRPSQEAFAKDRTGRLGRTLQGTPEENRAALWKSLGLDRVDVPAKLAPNSQLLASVEPDLLELFNQERRRAGLSIDEVRAFLNRRFQGKTARDLSPQECEQFLTWLRSQTTKAS